MERETAVIRFDTAGEGRNTAVFKARTGGALVILLSLVGYLLPPCGLFGSDEASNLILNSPFIPADYQSSRGSNSRKTRNPSASLLSRNIQFRGLVQINSEWEFCIYDTKSKKGDWVPLGNADAAYHVLEFFPETQSIMVKRGDVEEEIFLERSEGPLPQIGIQSMVQNLPTIPSKPPAFTPPKPPGKPLSRKPPDWIPTLPPDYRRNGGRAGRNPGSGSSISRSRRSVGNTAPGVPSRNPPSIPPSLKIPGPPPSAPLGPPPELPPDIRNRLKERN